MRTRSERRADALARLEGDRNLWLATASAEGVPHLVPLWFAWDGTRLVAATPTDSPTVRNIVATGRARAALDSAERVVAIEGTVEAVPVAEADPAVLAVFATKTGWNPADSADEVSVLLLTPRTVRAWNDEPEIEGRTIMRAGRWLD